MTQRIAATLLLSTLLSACATYTPYTPQVGESTARLRVVTYTSDSTDFVMHDVSVCPERKVLINKYLSSTSSSPAKLGMRGIAEDGAKDATELVIPAERRVSLVVGSSGPPIMSIPGYTCFVGFLFEPKPGAEYELQYKFQRKLDQVNKCQAGVYELVETKPGMVVRSNIKDVSLLSFGPFGPNLCSNR